MNARYAGSGDRECAAADSPILVAFAISILVHATFLVVLLASLPGLTAWNIQGNAGERLVVELASQSGGTSESRALPAPAAPSPSPNAGEIAHAGTRAPVATKRVVPPAATNRAARPVLAVAAPEKAAVPPPSSAPEEHAASAPHLTPETPANPARAPALVATLLETPMAAILSARAAPTVGADLSSYIAARRRERYEQRAPTDDDVAQRTRIIASDAPALRSPVPDERTRRGGGIFEITRMADDDAEFLFFGWNRDEGRRKTLAYQVRLGDNGDMHIAVVRTMIAIIREHEDGDFRWQSYRLGHIVVLSARRADNAGLEDFMLQEFFASDSAAPRR
jgi:hypothetical protein